MAGQMVGVCGEPTFGIAIADAEEDAMGILIRALGTIGPKHVPPTLEGVIEELSELRGVGLYEDRGGDARLEHMHTPGSFVIEINKVRVVAGEDELSKLAIGFYVLEKGLEMADIEAVLRFFDHDERSKAT